MRYLGDLRSVLLLSASSLFHRTPLTAFFVALSGGQFIRRKTAKAYDLDEETGAGIAFYQFSKLGESGSMESATQGDMRKIKIWFRDGLDAGAGDNLELKRE